MPLCQKTKQRRTLTLPKSFLQNLKSLKKNKKNFLFLFFRLNLNFEFYQKIKKFLSLYSTDLSMKSLIPISFCIFPKSYLIVVNCGLIT